MTKCKKNAKSGMRVCVCHFFLVLLQAICKSNHMPIEKVMNREQHKKKDKTDLRASKENFPREEEEK